MTGWKPIPPIFPQPRRHGETRSVFLIRARITVGLAEWIKRNSPQSGAIADFRGNSVIRGAGSVSARRMKGPLPVQGLRLARDGTRRDVIKVRAMLAPLRGKHANRGAAMNHSLSERVSTAGLSTSRQGIKNTRCRDVVGMAHGGLRSRLGGGDAGPPRLEPGNRLYRHRPRECRRCLGLRSLRCLWSTVPGGDDTRFLSDRLRLRIHKCQPAAGDVIAASGAIASSGHLAAPIDHPASNRRGCRRCGTVPGTGAGGNRSASGR